MLPTLLASLFLPGARAGGCADSATLDYPVGLEFQRGSRAPPYEALGGSADGLDDSDRGENTTRCRRKNQIGTFTTTIEPDLNGPEPERT